MTTSRLLESTLLNRVSHLPRRLLQAGAFASVIAVLIVDLTAVFVKLSPEAPSCLPKTPSSPLTLSGDTLMTSNATSALTTLFKTTRPLTKTNLLTELGHSFSTRVWIKRPRTFREATWQFPHSLAGTTSQTTFVRSVMTTMISLSSPQKLLSKLST